MADFEDAENLLNNSQNQFNSVGMVRDNNDVRRNTVNAVNFGK